MDCDRILNPIAPHLINTITVESSLPEKAVNVCCHDEVSGKGTRELRCLWLKSIKIHQMSQRKKLTQAAFSSLKFLLPKITSDLSPQYSTKTVVAAVRLHPTIFNISSSCQGNMISSEKRRTRIAEFNRKTPRQHSDFVRTVLDESSL